MEDLVKDRTQELQLSIENLLATQNQLVESEKMASLGRLVAGVAHELNTPIGICITGASYLQEKLQNLEKLFLDGEIRKKDLQNFIDSAPQSTDIILANLNRAAEQISNFKLVAVDPTSERKREINLHKYINKVVQSLYPAIKRANHQIEVTGDKELSINTIPGDISQIITNLVMNSIYHAYSDKQEGRITINIESEEDDVCITYTDDGAGMDKATQQMIFEPFFTTKRGMGGSGLGMYIVYNLLTQSLQGEISCQSEIGQGTQFSMKFPTLHHDNSD